MSRNSQTLPFKARNWRLGHQREMELGPKSRIMGILNVTPDSFSDGGINLAEDNALKTAHEMIDAGADIIDIGGESTRPGAEPISALEEQRRVIPVIEALSSSTSVIISIDTYRADTAKQAISAGAHIVNDVWGLQRDKDIAKVVADTGAGACIMHTGRDREKHADCIRDQIEWFEQSLEVARKAGIPSQNIALDPGFGFAKEVDENIDLMARFSDLHKLGYPLLVGTSRKRFIGALTGRDAADRDIGTAATSALLRMKGASIFRVHDIASNKDALAIVDAMLEAEWNE